MTVYRLGTISTKAKLLDEAVGLMLAAGNLGILKIEESPTDTPEEDGPDKMYAYLMVEGHTGANLEIRQAGKGNYTKRYSTPYSNGSYRVPITARHKSNYSESIGRGVFVDLAALQKITRVCKVSTDITIELTSEEIVITGTNFRFALEAAKTKAQQNSIVERQIEKQYGVLHT